MRIENKFEVFNEQGEAYSRTWGVLYLVIIGILTFIFKAEITAAFTTYTVIMAASCLGGFAALAALGWHWPKPAESYWRELLMIVVLDAAFTLTLCEHRKYLWLLPFAANKFAYELACLFTYRNGQLITVKVRR